LAPALQPGTDMMFRCSSSSAPKSNFSFLEGASHPEELVSYARELGLPAIGIADRDGIYGLVRAYREVKERGGKLVSGAELTIEYDGAAPRGAPRTVFLLIRDHDGYRSLCRLLTIAHQGYDKGTARLRLATLAEVSLGLELVVATDEPLLASWAAPCAWGEGWRRALEAFAGACPRRRAPLARRARRAPHRGRRAALAGARGRGVRDGPPPLRPALAEAPRGRGPLRPPQDDPRFARAARSRRTTRRASARPRR
jgi:error-prone DNA polymerase